MKRNRGVFAPKILLPLLAVGAIGVGAVGVLSLLDRRGEAAINLIPADAMLAVSFDNTPAPNQVLLFKEISNAMEDSGLNRFVDEMMDTMGMPPEAKAIKENLKGSFAIGVWGDMMEGSPDMLLAAALHNPRSAENIVAQHGEKLPINRASVYQMDQDVVIAFHQDYAIVTNSVENIERALDASEQKATSFAKTASFEKARENLPREASLMVFVNGAAVANADEATREMYRALGMEGSGWAAFSATVVAEGIQMDMYQEMEKGHAITESYDRIPALTYASIDRLPAGAYGVAAISGLGTMLETLPTIMDKSPEMNEFSSMFEELEAETGMSFEDDLIPALAGETYIAIYPGESSEEPRFVFMFDKQNGATPDAAVRKMIAKEEGLTSTKQGDLEIFSSPDGEAYVAIAPDGVIVSNDDSIIKVRPSEGIASSGSLAKFDEGAPAVMKMQVDLRKIFAMIREHAPDANIDMIEAALSQDTMDVSVSINDGVVKSRALLPLKMPELVRYLGKSATEYRESMESMEGMEFSDEDFSGEFTMPEQKPEEEMMRDAKAIGAALKTYASENNGEYPSYMDFAEGKLDKLIGGEKVREGFIYLPPVGPADDELGSTEAGFFMSGAHRIVVFFDGRVEKESFEDFSGDHGHDH